MKNSPSPSRFSMKVTETTNAQALGFFVNQDEKRAPVPATGLPGIADPMLKGSPFKGAAKTTLFLRSTSDEPHVLFIGVGQKKELTPETFRLAGSAAYSKVQAEGAESFAISFDELVKAAGSKLADACLEAFLHGYGMTAYKFDKYKSEKKEAKILKIEVVASGELKKRAVAMLNRAVIQLDAIQIVRDFSNEPSNFGTPEFYASEIQKICKAHGLKCRVLNEAAAKKEKMDLFLSVGNGSKRESQVVIITYEPKTKAKKTIAFAGKGVTFDTGGISLKPGARMEDMKHDMTGAATLFGATLAAARMGCKNRIVTILGFTENMPSSTATTPSSVVTARNGKTVEIINTDAEGRLVLGDVLDLCCDEKPDLVVDVATLTGACGIALGKFCSALFVNNDKLLKHFHAAEEKTAERLWQLPLWDEYFEDMKSATADMMNISSDGTGGTIRGAIFLKQFVRKGTDWAHIDIANRASDNPVVPYHPRKGASGVYTRFLTELAMDFE